MSGEELRNLVNGMVNLIVKINATLKHIMETISFVAPRDAPKTKFRKKIKKIKKSNPLQLLM
jgi:hypothetical protein